MDKMTGIVKWFNTQKGYGFISTDKVADIFVHYSAIDDSGFKNLNEGDQVTFELVDGARRHKHSTLTPFQPKH